LKGTGAEETILNVDTFVRNTQIKNDEGNVLQVANLGNAFNPFTYWGAKAPTKRVYAYADKTLRALGDRDRLPDACIVDVAHVFFAMQKNGPVGLRAIAERPEASLQDVLAATGMVKDVSRMTLTDSTLGGLLSEKTPAYAKKTIILLNIRTAGQISNDIAFSFSAAPGQRVCCAEPVIMAWFQAVQDEYRKLIA
jgi:hypothetical protein